MKRSVTILTMAAVLASLLVALPQARSAHAWKPDQDGNHNLTTIAFALGYMGGHANGDVWAHTWINHYADGVFPDFTDLTHADISVRHVLVEGYADKHRPGFEATAAQDEAGLDHTRYEIAGPTAVIADRLILAD